MTTTTAGPIPAKGATPPTAVEISVQSTCAELCDAHTSSTNRYDFFERSLKILAKHFQAPLVMMGLDSGSGTQNLMHRESEAAAMAWSRHCDGLALEARYRKLSKAKFYKSEGVEVPLAVLAVPLQIDGQGLSGSVALVAAIADKMAAECQLSTLQTLVSMIGSLSNRLQSTTTKPAAEKPASATADHAAVSKAAGYSSMSQFAFAIVNNLKGKLNCDAVCLGLVKNNSARLYCISDLSQVAPRSAGTRMIEQVMDECLDAGEVLCYQKEAETTQEKESANTGHLLHRRWSAESGGAPVASIPLAVDGKTVAVLSIRASDIKPFAADQLKKIQELAAPLMPGLLLLQRADRTCTQHMKAAAYEQLNRWVLTSGWGVRCGLVLACGLFAFCLFGKQTYWLSVPCELTPSQERHVAAPFEGTIESVLVRPGETVTKGTVLVRMDTRQLVLDKERAMADLRTAELELRQAAAKNDIAVAAQAQTRATAARSQLNKVDRYIRQSEIIAPQDGVIVSGDLQPRVGEVVPLGEPLLRIAPVGHWKLKLRAPEFAATLLDSGQSGTFATLARPDAKFNCKVEFLYGEAEVFEGKNIVTAEASLGETPPAWARAGMDGHARIDVGEHPVWWVWSHRVIDTTRIQLLKL